MKKKSTGDINERNAAFWAEIKSRVDPLMNDIELVGSVAKKQSLDLMRAGGKVSALNSFEHDMLAEHGQREGEKARSTLEKQRATRANSQAKATAASRKYSTEDRAKWQEIADTLFNLSMKRKAEIIAQRLGLSPSAVETIRKNIN